MNPVTKKIILLQLLNIQKILQVRLELTTSASMEKYGALTNCATGAVSLNLLIVSNKFISIRVR